MLREGTQRGGRGKRKQRKGAECGWKGWEMKGYKREGKGVFARLAETKVWRKSRRGRGRRSWDTTINSKVNVRVDGGFGGGLGAYDGT